MYRSCRETAHHLQPETGPNWPSGAWDTFRDELPWLNRSHRALVEIAATIRARVMTGNDIGVKAMNLLSMCLGQLGATPPVKRKHM
jgi:hypothetical protein